MPKRPATKILNTGLVPPPGKHITALAATTRRAKATALIPRPATTVKSAAAPLEGRASSLYLPNGLLLHPCSDRTNALENAFVVCDLRFGKSASGDFKSRAGIVRKQRGCGAGAQRNLQNTACCQLKWFVDTRCQLADLSSIVFLP